MTMKNLCFIVLFSSVMILSACKAQKKSTPNYGSVKEDKEIKI